ncbi:MAG: hypothetical protein U5S82_00630 [Gammaproteobacteria bacterium]|nr:hypothetical protein [Gammaproteobacteria bacterium]
MLKGGEFADAAVQDARHIRVLTEARRIGGHARDLVADVCRPADVTWRGQSLATIRPSIT